MLLAAASSLRHLSGVCVTEPATLRRLWALGSLTRLEARLDAAAFGDLHLPEHLQFLSVVVDLPHGKPFHQLSLESPGLRTLTLSSFTPWTPPPVLLSLRCPALVNLSLMLSSLAVLGLAADASPPLRCLTIAGGMELSDASLLDVLVRHGHHLQHVALAHCFGKDPCRAWPSLQDALGRLPRLASLELTPAPNQEMTLLPTSPAAGHWSTGFARARLPAAGGASDNIRIPREVPAGPARTQPASHRGVDAGGDLGGG
ncbi:hypothetical protein PAPYR_10133 [Paratrimastix pyriformis]|uniref:Uncharacterized protein n=1 Tax=Paratrimastix pyriformis TaxID=342808 RepID=A0ABQ8U6L5_9EUKA|nr:hypothetical protein PAPYR_10133 [Paratrimastix pyriformis]